MSAKQATINELISSFIFTVICDSKEKQPIFQKRKPRLRDWLFCLRQHMIEIQGCLLQDPTSVSCVLHVESYLGPNTFPLWTLCWTEAPNQITDTCWLVDSFSKYLLRICHMSAYMLDARKSALNTMGKHPCFHGHLRVHWEGETSKNRYINFPRADGQERPEGCHVTLRTWWKLPYEQRATESSLLVSEDSNKWLEYLGPCHPCVWYAQRKL